jgi:hypothetical protein
MSIDLELQKDLHAAFQLLYDDEDDLDFEADWKDHDDEDEELENVELEDIPTVIQTSFEQSDKTPELRSTRYSKVRVRSADHRPKST